MTNDSPSVMTSNAIAQVLEHTINAVVITDPQGRITWVNAGFERITGYTLAEVIGRSPGKVLQGPQSDPVVDEVMKTAINVGRSFDVTILNYRKDKTHFWNHIQCQPLHEGDVLTGFMAIETDVTPTIQFQNQLIEANSRAAENAERMLLAFAGGQVGSWDWNPQTDQLFLHESWERFVGVEVGSLVQKLESWLTRIHPEDVSGFRSELEAITNNQQDSFTAEHRILCARDHFRWTLARGQVVARNSAGQPTRVVGVHLDITEQKRTQTLLDEQNNLLRTILNVIPFAVCWKDSQLRFLGCNEHFARLTGFETGQSLIGKTDQDLHASLAEAIQFQQDDIQVINTGEPILHKIESLTGPDGNQLILDTSKAPLKLHNGSVGVLGVFIDITELERTRESLRLREAELRHRGRMEAVGELAGGVAHEFNNLMQAIRGYVSFAMDELTPGSAPHQDLAESLQAISRAVELTQQLLGFSRLDEVKKTLISPELLIADLRVLLRPLLPASILVNYEVAENLPPLSGSPVALGQTLLNLCVNARDAMPHGGKLTIGCQLLSSPHTGSEVELYVADTGYGIPPEIRERIFDPFFTTKEVGSGTGLGLSMAYSTVLEHHGTIELNSEVGVGTRFSIRLTVAPTQHPVGSPVEPPADVPKTAASSQRRTILVAEDDPIVMRVTIRMLQNLGYHVLAAVNGREAVDLFQSHQNQISALVFDVMMPTLTGTEAYQEICQLGAPPPIVFCSGYDSDEANKQLLQRTGFQLINKPFNQNTLKVAVEMVLSESPVSA